MVELPDDLPSVEMHHAFFWLCSDCGEKNWCEGMSCEDPEEQEKYDELALGPTLVLRIPRKVCCIKCGAWWGTDYPGAIMEEEGEDVP